MEPVFISLVSVAVGWLLAQGTALTKDWWAARKLRVGLLTELEDIEAQLQRVVMMHSRQLQIYANKGIEPAVSLPIENMFFRQYFKEAFAHLTREQRISYQLIHSTLDTFNKKSEAISSLLEEFHKQHTTAPDEQRLLATINIWGDRVIAAYKTAMDVRWHIAYHLRNPQRPTFDINGPMHESYLKFAQELDDDVKLIMEKAKGIKREDFERIYDTKSFSAKHSAG